MTMQEKIDELIIEIQVKSFESMIRLKPQNYKHTTTYLEKCIEVQKVIEDDVHFVLKNADLPEELKETLINLLKGSEEVTAELRQRKEILDIGTVTKIPVTMPMKMEIN